MKGTWDSFKLSFEQFKFKHSVLLRNFTSSGKTGLMPRGHRMSCIGSNRARQASTEGKAKGGKGCFPGQLKLQQGWE